MKRGRLKGTVGVCPPVGRGGSVVGDRSRGVANGGVEVSGLVREVLVSPIVCDGLGSVPAVRKGSVEVVFTAVAGGGRKEEGAVVSGGGRDVSVEYEGRSEKGKGVCLDTVGGGSGPVGGRAGVVKGLVGVGGGSVGVVSGAVDLVGGSVCLGKGVEGSAGVGGGTVGGLVGAVSGAVGLGKVGVVSGSVRVDYGCKGEGSLGGKGDQDLSQDLGGGLQIMDVDKVCVAAPVGDSRVEAVGDSVRRSVGSFVDKVKGGFR